MSGSEFREFEHEPTPARWSADDAAARVALTLNNRSATYRLSEGAWVRTAGRTWVGTFGGVSFSIRLPRCSGPTPLAVDGAAYRRRTKGRRP